MIIEDSPEIYGYTIFCDDIRMEIGNKLTYVGVYLDGIVPGGPFPIVMPKLAMQVFYMQRHPNIVAPTKFIIVLPESSEDEPSFQIDFPQQANHQALEAVKQLTQAESEKPYFKIGFQFNIINLVLTKPGLIKVRAERDKA